MAVAAATAALAAPAEAAAAVIVVAAATATAGRALPAASARLHRVDTSEKFGLSFWCRKLPVVGVTAQAGQQADEKRTMAAYREQAAVIENWKWLWDDADWLVCRHRPGLRSMTRLEDLVTRRHRVWATKALLLTSCKGNDRDYSSSEVLLCSNRTSSA